MTHTTPQGAPKIVRECTLPVTARGVVDVVITELAVFRFDGNELVLVELQPDSTLAQVRERTAAPFRVAI
jgi:3-oxoacid CoA-transferase